MKIYTGSVNTDAVECIADIFRIMPPDAPYHSLHYMYRGQEQFKWDLVPGIFRVDPFAEGAGQSWQGVEIHLLQAFMREAAPYLEGFHATPFRQRMLAQHYGLPTRLLDWSLNPLVALYFAVEDLELREDAAFYVGQARMGLTGAVDSMREGEINTFDFVELLPAQFDSRILAQKAVFTTHILPEGQTPFSPPQDVPTDGPRIYKFRIPAARKARIKLELEQVGIDHAHLFPGLQGIGTNLRWMFTRQRHWREYIGSWDNS